MQAIVVAQGQGQLQTDEHQGAIDARKEEAPGQAKTEFEESVEGDGHLQQPDGKKAETMAHVLVDEDRHRLALEVEDAQRLGATALPSEVDDFGGGHVVDLPAGRMDAIAPVDVVPVHEVVLVHHSHLIHGFFAHHHAGSGKDLDLADLLRIQVGHVVVPEARMVGKEAAQSRHLAEGCQRRGETAPAVQLEGAVRVENLTAGGSRFRMGIHEIDQGAQRVLADEGVGVEQHDVATGRLFEGDVVAGGKAEIRSVEDQPRLGELLRHHLGTAVARVVVGYEDLHLQTLGRIDHRAQSAFSEISGVVAEEYYTQVHEWLAIGGKKGTSALVRAPPQQFATGEEEYLLGEKGVFAPVELAATELPVAEDKGER